MAAGRSGRSRAEVRQRASAGAASAGSARRRISFGRVRTNRRRRKQLPIGSHIGSSGFAGCRQRQPDDRGPCGADSQLDQRRDGRGRRAARGAAEASLPQRKAQVFAGPARRLLVPRPEVSARSSAPAKTRADRPSLQHRHMGRISRRPDCGTAAWPERRRRTTE